MRLAMYHSDNISKNKLLGLLISVCLVLTAEGAMSSTFPRPYKIGGKIMFSEKEVRDWIESQKAARL